MAQYKLLLPKMGESVAEATVIKWTKKPGDHVEADETVMEIATDKVDSEVPSPVTGKLLEQLCKEDEVVQVGAVIAIIETGEPEEVKPPTIPAAAPVVTAPPVIHTPPTIPAPPVIPPAPPTFHIEEAPAPVQIETPAPVQPEAVHVPEPIAEIHHPVAQAEKPVEVAPMPEPLAEVKQPVFFEQREDLSHPVPYTEQLASKEEPKTDEPSKNESRFYSPLVKNIAAQEGIGNAELDRIPGTGAEGRLTKDDLLNHIQNRFQITSPTVSATSQEEAKPAEPHTASLVEAPVTSTETHAPEPVEGTTPVAEQQEPVAENEAQPGLVEVPQPEPLVEAHSPFVEKAEPVIQTPEPEPFIEAPEPAPVAEAPKPEPIKPTYTEPAPKSAVSMSGGDEIIEMDRMGRLIADHMVMSKHTSPHVTSFVEADVTNLVLWREKIKGAFEKREAEKITFTPLFIEAVVRAIKDMPMINVQVNGTQIIKKKDINIGMATALPNGNLIVPVIKRADELSLIGLTKSVNDLANRGRGNKLKPDDIQGGTFTITNVGSFGNVMGTPIINQPQVAILAVGAIRKKPAVIETLQGDMIGIRHMMFLSLSYDHRVVNGALGGSFVRRVADYLENWDPGREI